MRTDLFLFLCLPMGCQIGLKDWSEVGPSGKSGAPLLPGETGRPPHDTGGNDSGVTEPSSSTDTGDTPSESAVVSCGAIEAADGDWEVCLDGEEHCEAVYLDGAGCTAVCAAVDLTCTGAYENRDDACAPDLERDLLPCDSGHQSDYCICGGSGVSAMPEPAPDRFAQLLSERAGFGRDAMGGDPSQVYTVTTLADEGAGSLRAALESDAPWTIVFAVDGLITWVEDVRVQSNKTVDGRGRDITVDGTWRLQDVHDVIISDLSVTRSPRDGEEICEQDGDVMVIRGQGGDSPSDFTAYNIWLHHLAFRDGGDGLLDIRGGTGITVSWSHFSHHKKVSLAWQDEDGRPTPGMEVTWHHNHFDHTTVRNPRFHYGRAHFVNNFMDEWWQSGAASYDEAEFFSEANVYKAADDCYGVPGVLPCVDDNPCAVNNDWFVDRSLAVVTAGSSDPGKVRSVDDLLINGALIEVTRPAEVFDPADDYSFPVEAATDALATQIAAQAGPRTDWTE